MVRLFIGIDAPPTIKEEISELQSALKHSNADVRWESSVKLHITLRFLGSTDSVLLPEIVSILDGLCSEHPPFQITYSGIGCFPDRRRPRSVWVGVQEETGELLRLQQAINQKVIALGFEPEDKTFHPHVTLGRIKSSMNVNRLLAIMESTTFENQPAVVSHIDLFKSDLRSEGSVYATLNSFSLRG